mgnify:FL=1
MGTKLKKLTYWKCANINGDDCYSIRAKTKKAATAQREEDGPENYTKPFKVEIEYLSVFDLMEQSQGPGGLYENRNAVWD